MRLVLALEEKIGRELDAEEIVKIECLNDVRAILVDCDRSE
jgi:acyl carrier protein